MPILKHDGVRQWEGWQPIYEMENNPFMFETTNQGVLSGIFTQLLQMLQMVDLPISKVGIFQLAKITSRVTTFDHYLW